VRHVCDHTKPLRVLLTRESNVTPASFIETAIMQLVEALQGKTTQAKSRNDLKQLFLANNYGYISNSLPPCSDKEIAAHIAQEIKPRIDELCDTAIKAFITTSYQLFETFLCDPKEKLVYAKGGSLLTLESGRLLKEKFAVRIAGRASVDPLAWRVAYP
jgi:exocyst complex component 7